MESLDADSIYAVVIDCYNKTQVRHITLEWHICKYAVYCILCIID